jgi:hypothetical protein
MFDSKRATLAGMQPLAFAALGVVTVLSVVLFILGRRFQRGYYEKHRQMPRMTWMFHDSGAPDGPRPAPDLPDRALPVPVPPVGPAGDHGQEGLAGSTSWSGIVKVDVADRPRIE